MMMTAADRWNKLVDQNRTEGAERAKREYEEAFDHLSAETKELLSRLSESEALALSMVVGRFLPSLTVEGEDGSRTPRRDADGRRMDEIALLRDLIGRDGGQSPAC